jgi:hypothetical protein
MASSRACVSNTGLFPRWDPESRTGSLAGRRLSRVSVSALRADRRPMSIAGGCNWFV